MVKNGHKILRRTAVHRIISERIQQWKCKNCHFSGTFRNKKGTRSHTTNTCKESLVTDWILGHSIGALSLRWGFAKGSICSWIHTLAHTLPDSIETAILFKLNTTNYWGGTLLLDGKRITNTLILLLALDYKTGDIVSWCITQNEGKESYKTLITQVLACGYHITGIVSDGAAGIFALTHKRVPPELKYGGTYHRPGHPVVSYEVPLEGVPHQWCIVHAQRELYGYITKEARKNTQSFYKRIVHEILFAKTYKSAYRRKQQLATLALTTRDPLLLSLVLTISRRWRALTTHYQYPAIPATTNTIEA